MEFATESKGCLAGDQAKLDSAICRFLVHEKQRFLPSDLFRLVEARPISSINRHPKR